MRRKGMTRFVGNALPVLQVFMLSAMLLAGGCTGSVSYDTATVNSPDGKISFRLYTNGGNEKNLLVYDVTYGGAEVVHESPLGVVILAGGKTTNISKNLEGTDLTLSNLDETYSMPYGKTREIRNHYNEAVLSLKSPEGIRMDVTIRAYDDGVAFRYRFPEQEGLERLEITDELTGFDFASDHRYWGLHLDSFTRSYETDYTIATLGNITAESLIGLPLLIEIADDAWAAVTEADLTDYAGMYVRGDSGRNFLLKAELSPLPDSSGVRVRAPLPHKSPWRVIMLADDPGRLVESNIILNLNDPCTFDTSWIKPGKTAWDWWSGQVVKGAGFEGRMDNRTMKHYIDFAGEYGLEYMLIDAGWYGGHRNGAADITKSIPEIDIPELVEYAKARNVGILLWLNWKCVDRQMDEAFPLYERWGVKGVKVDYMNRDDQEMVNFYHRVVKKAAEHKLIVDFHGAYKPTGIRRTYPNLITREGVMGLEYVKWSDRITPDHDCILPFTRMLAGPMDYTPGGFTNAPKGRFQHRSKEPMTMGTRCHQLALYVIFESPLQMLVDYPSNYRGETGMEFLRRVPTTWDETRVLRAAVGDCAVIARRQGGEWYLGGITDWDARELRVSLAFLGKGGYAAEIYTDGPDAATNGESVKYEERDVTPSDTLTIGMAPGGGFAVRFSPVR